MAIKLPIIDTFNGRMLPDSQSFLPLRLPKAYLERIEKFHGDPFVWWAGQILHYIMKFNSDMRQVITKKSENLNFKAPCVGYVAKNLWLLN